MKSTLRSRCYAICALFISLQIDAAETVLPYGSRHALYLAPLTAPTEPTISENNQQFFPPASTLKIITALAAKLQLGDQFRFQTTLKQLNNDYIIEYSGDPSFSRQDLRSMLIHLVKSSQGQIDTLWLDNSAFAGYSRAVGWPWDILGVCYSAPASAITLDGNCVQGALYTNQTGSTRVNIPAHQPITVSTSATVSPTTETTKPPCQLDLLTYPDNRYQLSGCIGYRTSPLPLKFAVASPELFTQAVIEQELSKLNITRLPKIKIGAPKQEQYAKPLLIHRSAPLQQLLVEVLQQSNNLYADNLTKTLGISYFKQPGSFANGTQAIKNILREQAGINLDLAVFEDGSGLSRNNRISADQLAQVLTYIYQHDSTLELIKLLPIAAKSGTLQYRASMRKAPIRHSIAAKSGSLFGTYNMAGYGLNSQGKPTSVFVQFISDYHPDSTIKPTGISPLQSFEQNFYQQVVDFSTSK